MGRDRGVIVTIARWIARGSAGLSAAVILLIFVGDALAEDLGPLLGMSLRETSMMVAFAGVWLGLVLGWFRELAGGLLTLCSLMAFYLLDYAFSGTFPRGPYFLILASPSLVFLYLGLRGRARTEATRAA